MTELDFVNHVGLVATFGTELEQPLIAAGRYIACGRGGKRPRAEVAFAVLEEHQGTGIGSLLLKHLAKIGRAQGICEFQADVLADNRQMIAVLERSCFPIERSTEFGVDRVLLKIGDESPDRRRSRILSSCAKPVCLTITDSLTGLSAASGRDLRAIPGRDFE